MKKTILRKHYEAIGAKGGKTLLAKRGPEYFRELNKKSIAKRRKKKTERVEL